MKKAYSMSSELFPCFFFCLILFGVPFSTFGQTAKKAQEQKTGPAVTPLNPLMVQIGQTMEELYLTLFNDGFLNTVKKKEFVRKKIEELQQSFEMAGPHFEKKALSYKISYEVMKDHLYGTRKALDRIDNFDYALFRMQGVSFLCSNCHTQEGKGRTLFKDVSQTKFNSEFKYAEFNYMTRGFDKAKESYDKVIRDSDVAKSTQEEKELAVQRKLVINILVKHDPQLALQDLEKDLAETEKKKIFSVAFGKEMKAWQEGLKEWLKEEEKGRVGHATTIQGKELEEFVTTHLLPLEGQEFTLQEGKKKVLYLRLAALLYKKLNQRPLPADVPKYLYWLALTDRALNYSFYFSLADLYLKECIINYSADPIAKKCLKEYEEFTVFSFTGSSGTNIPEDVKEELKVLKEKVQKAQKLNP